LGLLAAVAMIAPSLEHVTALALGTATSMILVLVAVWETLSLRK
jgi:hypothetical protein